MHKPLHIAIDGPVAAGKSTICYQLAHRLHLDYLNTGRMYRMLADAIATNMCDVTDEDVICRQLKRLEKTVFSSYDAFQSAQTDQLDSPQIGAIASAISTSQRVRNHMIAIQKRLIGNRDIVVEGRDIGKKVLPHASLKLFLTASVACRVQRRKNQLQKKQHTATEKEIIADIKKRDRNDTTRRISPLEKTAEHIVIDTSDMTITDVVSYIVSLLSKYV